MFKYNYTQLYVFVLRHAPLSYPLDSSDLRHSPSFNKPTTWARILEGSLHVVVWGWSGDCAYHAPSIWSRFSLVPHADTRFVVHLQDELFQPHRSVPRVLSRRENRRGFHLRPLGLSSQLASRSFGTMEFTNETPPACNGSPVAGRTSGKDQALMVRHIKFGLRRRWTRRR